MAHNIDRTMCYADATSGLDVAKDVAAVLGRASTDIGCLCADIEDEGNGDLGGKVNKWALNKPIRCVGLGTLTETQRYLYDCGFDTTTGAGIAEKGGQSAVNTLMTLAISHTGSVWSYLHPQGGSASPYRITDFNYYNHIAAAPFGVVSTGTTIEGDSAANYPDSILKITANAEIDISRLRVFETENIDASSMYIGFMVKQPGVSNVKLFLNSTPYGELFDGYSELTVNVDFEEGTNYCQAVLTSIPPTDISGGVIDAQADLQDCVTVALPECFQTFVLSPVANAIIASEGWAYNGDPYFYKADTDAQGYVTAITPKVLCTNATGASQSVTVTTNLLFNGNTLSSVSAATTIAAAGTAYITLPSIDPGDFVGGSEFSTDDLPDIQVKLSWTWASKTRRWNFVTAYPALADPGYAYFSDNDNIYYINQ